MSVPGEHLFNTLQESLFSRLVELEQSAADYCEQIGNFHTNCLQTVSSMKQNRESATENATKYQQTVEDLEKWLSS